MKRANEITEELRSMDSILADLPRTVPYAVPAGYFAELAGTVRTTINKVSENEQVPGWSKTMPFTVPVNYFTDLPEEVTTESIAASLPKSTPFSVPQGYFDTLPTQMLQAAKAGDNTQNAKVIPLKRNNMFRQLRWAAAAFLVTGLGLGAYQALQKQQTNTENILASVPANELQDYVQGMYRIDVDRVVDNNDVSNMQLDNKDIIQYLNETGWD